MKRMQKKLWRNVADSYGIVDVANRKRVCSVSELVKYCETYLVVSKPYKLMINESELTGLETSAILLGSKMLLKGEGQGDFFMVADADKGWTQSHWRKYIDRYPQYAEEAKLAVDRLGKPFTV